MVFRTPDAWPAMRQTSPTAATRTIMVSALALAVAVALGATHALGQSVAGEARDALSGRDKAGDEADDAADAVVGKSAVSQAPRPGMTTGTGPGAIVPPIVPSEPVVAAKLLFGSKRVAAPLAARSIGYYSRGCLSGGEALPVNGPAWQAMRLSRNRNWGHPELVKLVSRFAVEAKADGWPGLLVGDMSQPRGGPMLTGHASHQVGLDADIWFTPMPARLLTKAERENMSAVSMLAPGHLAVDPKVWDGPRHMIIKRAASYDQVERVLVHPAIKKALCEASAKDADRKWLHKVRPVWGHYYHFHIRMLCPAGMSGCKAQSPPEADDGCGKELDTWYKLMTAPPKKADPNAPKAKPKPPITLADLPQDCRAVLEADDAVVSSAGGGGKQ